MKIEAKKFKVISKEFYKYLKENNLLNNNMYIDFTSWKGMEKIVVARLQGKNIAINLNRKD